MANRVVEGTIHANGSPLVGGLVRFVLVPGSYTDQTQYISTTEQALTGQDGKFAKLLWCNALGKIPTKWRCILPDGDSFEFVLLPSTTPIDISTLRDEGDEAYPGILQIFQYVDEKIAANGGGGGGGNYVFQRLDFSQYPNYQLTQIPTAPHLSQFFVNGQKQIYGLDYTVNGSVVNWLGFELFPNFIVEFYS